MKTQILAALVTDSPEAATLGLEAAELSIEQLLQAEPIADRMLAEVRTAIGTNLRDERAALGLSLEEVRDKSGRSIDSGGLSRLERGQSWSGELAGTARKFYARERAKQAKADARKQAKAAASYAVVTEGRRRAGA